MQQIINGASNSPQNQITTQENDFSKVKTSIVCCTCGRGKEVELNKPIKYGFELASIAHDIGMLGVHDYENSRVLVFCDSKCRDIQKKKNGYFRKRLLTLDRSEGNGLINKE